MSESGSDSTGFNVDDAYFKCYRSQRENCVVCAELKKNDYKLVAHKRSVKTAHILAIREACVGLDRRFDFLDMYTVMFRKIYEHEYTRNSKVEYERLTHFTYLDAKRNNKEICHYHDEFDEGFCTGVHKEVEAKYAKCKWPKKLPDGWSKR